MGSDLPLMHPAFALIPRTRQQILWFIKTQGAAQAEAIAEHVGISLSGARQHLSALESEGLLSHGERRDGPGRPRHVYKLTPAAEAFFPATYAEFTNDILDELAEEDPTMLMRLIEKRARKRLEQLKPRFAGLPLEAKVRTLAHLLDQDGFLVDVQQRENGGYLIVERNCSMLNVARKHGQVCTSELALIQNLLPEATVERVSYMVSGQHSCAYQITPLPQAATGA
jgi:DeoR family transcriptional regulator, suf operon transcriptional repressor